MEKHRSYHSALSINSFVHAHCAEIFTSCLDILFCKCSSWDVVMSGVAKTVSTCIEIFFYSINYTLLFVTLLFFLSIIWICFVIPHSTFSYNEICNVWRIHGIGFMFPCGSSTWYQCDFSQWRPTLSQQHLISLCNMMLRVGLSLLNTLCTL